MIMVMENLVDVEIALSFALRSELCIDDQNL